MCINHTAAYGNHCAGIDLLTHRRTDSSFLIWTAITSFHLHSPSREYQLYYSYLIKGYLPHVKGTTHVSLDNNAEYLLVYGEKTDGRYRPVPDLLPLVFSAKKCTGSVEAVFVIGVGQRIGTNGLTGARGMDKFISPDIYMPT
jgi:hypothetical protein